MHKAKSILGLLVFIAGLPEGIDEGIFDLYIVYIYTYVDILYAYLICIVGVIEEPFKANHEDCVEEWGKPNSPDISEYLLRRVQ